jgi:O-6-methylguanine DNA methyltransferase
METIHWMNLSSPVGELNLAATKKGCAFLCLRMNRKNFHALIRNTFPSAELKESQEFLTETLDDLKRYWKGNPKSLKTTFDLKGTSFQMKVWRELQKIPFGKTISYRELAKRIGKPKSARAVGGAVGKNPVSILIPCHRVIASDGTLGGYSGGLSIKQKLLAHEGADL